MDILWALLSIVGAVAIVFVAPLFFIWIFSLVSGFSERVSEGK